jgi:nicotinamidase-related amidase
MDLTEGAQKFSPKWVEPATTALVSMEMQRGVVGDLSRILTLVAAVAEGGIVGNLAALMKAARGAGIPVVHCNALFRADRKGSTAKVRPPTARC